ncbi:hypothetical protein NHH88_05890 [Oxalobacteraceae bacterium OTU3CAMAD1]|nr:hypothetical protein NHH88_05890 [Oxalobacteraceae bacterium OTU3CAMAD1]
MLLVICFSLTGCGNLRLYSDVRDKQGQEAKKAWDAVDFDTTVKTERENLKKLLVAERNLNAKLQIAIRDQRLRFMVASNLKDGLVDQINSLHETLSGIDDASNSVKLFIDTANRPPDFSSLQDEFKQFNLGEASCRYAPPAKASEEMADELANVDEKKSAQAKALYERLKKLCSINSSKFEVSLKPKGLLLQYIKDRDKAADSLNSFKNNVNELKENYTTARKVFDSQEKASPIEKVKKVKAAAEKLLAAAQALNASPSPVAQQFIASENIAAISDFAKAVSETPSDPGKITADAKSAAVALVIIPGLLDEATKAADDKRAMRALPLQMRADYEQLRLAAASRDIVSREQVVQLHKDLVQATLKEVLQLSLAYRELNLAPARETKLAKPDAKSVGEPLVKWLALPVTDLISKATPIEKQRFYTSAGLYLDVLSRLEAERFFILAQIDNAKYERGLAYAEINAKQWTSLIGLSVRQVSDSTADGIKTERVVSILNTLGLWSTAYGVNK